MIDTVHQSTLDMYLRCGEQFRRRYVLGHRQPPGVALGRGRGVHKANENNIKQKILSHTDLTLSDLQDVARDEFFNTFKEGIHLTRQERSAKNQILNTGLRDTLRLTRLYKSEVAPVIKPIDVESRFRISVPQVPIDIAGTLDIEETAVIRDLKTAGMSWNEGRPKQEIQPIFYSLAFIKKYNMWPDFVYHVLVALKEPKMQTFSIRVTIKDIERMFLMINRFVDGLNKGMFLPTLPSNWWCSEKWCGYWYNCKYVGNGERSTWV